jgi:N-acetyl-anhydromuramyl-L-alanine amidase AmpD
MASAANTSLVDGRLVSDRVTDKINRKIEKGALARVNAIVVHQTGGATAESSLASYNNAGANGAHFLIDKNGAIYQTARVNQKCWHVGRILSRCSTLKTCSPAELKDINKILFNRVHSYSARLTTLHHHESAKPYPDRYPTNEDSIGIEIVSMFSQKTGFEAATAAQNGSLGWLVSTLQRLLKLSASEVFRHSEVSAKQPTEATSARW